VPKKIYNILKSGKLHNAQDILFLFIDIISDFGFFDAHHEPQIHFFLKNDGSIGFNPSCFALENMNSVISDLGGDRTLKNSRKTSQRNKHRKIPKQRIQFALGLARLYKRNRNYMPLHKDSVQYKFNAEFGGDFNRLANHREQLNKCLVNLYKELQECTNDPKLLHFIESNYKTDLSLHKQLEANTLKQFTNIYYPK
jgi:hypothetical protein